MSGIRDVSIVDRQNSVFNFQFSFGSCFVGNYFGYKYFRFFYFKRMIRVIVFFYYIEVQWVIRFDNCYYFNGEFRIYIIIFIIYMIFYRIIGVY